MANKREQSPADSQAPEVVSRRKLIFLVTEDWYFCSHRLQLAVAAKASGFDVGVVTQVGQHGERIRDAGLSLFPIPFARSGRHPLQDLRTVLAVRKIYRQQRPDIVHHVSIKPILYGTLAASNARVPHVVNAYTGLGYLFTSPSWSARAMRTIAQGIWRGFLNNQRCWNIVQNADDRSMLMQSALIREHQTALIRGAGVDVHAFRPTQEAPEPVVVVLAARLLWDKGVDDFVEAARLLRAQGVHARFALVGEPDPENPMSVSRVDLERWQEEGVVEWWGRRADMPQVFAAAHIACLPSRREGLPKVLLEAAACGRPIVTTDTPGCREIVRHGENGFLVPVSNPQQLAVALRRLITDSGLRLAMGAQARRIAEREFADSKVIEQTLALYETILNAPTQV